MQSHWQSPRKATYMKYTKIPATGNPVWKPELCLTQWLKSKALFSPCLPPAPGTAVLLPHLTRPSHLAAQSRSTATTSEHISSPASSISQSCLFRKVSLGYTTSLHRHGLCPNSGIQGFCFVLWDVYNLLLRSLYVCLQSPPLIHSLLSCWNYISKYSLCYSLSYKPFHCKICRPIHLSILRVRPQPSLINFRITNWFPISSIMKYGKHALKLI